MNTIRNRLNAFAIFALALFASITVSAQAQVSYKLNTTSLNGGTNNIAAATTNSAVAITIPATYGSSVAIQPSFKLTGSGTSAVVFKFDRSVDGSTWETSWVSLSVTAAGTSTVTGITNVSAGSIGYLRLNTIENPNASAITNLTVKYAAKSQI